MPTIPRKDPFANLGGEFPAPKPFSELKMKEGNQWLWHGAIALGEVTLLSALWKVGKTTLLAHLLRALQTGAAFCDMPVQKARVLYLSEEGEHRWAVRRNDLGIGNFHHIICRPFLTKPGHREWERFILHLGNIQQAMRFDLILFDTISNLWPVTDENNAPEVTSALMPIHALTDHAGICLVHHLKKSDGAQGTGSRGSGALPAFADTVLELRRYAPNDVEDRRRVLTGYGRDDDTRKEMILELAEGGYAYCGEGREDVETADVKRGIDAVLHAHPYGATYPQIRDGWPKEVNRPGKARLLSELTKGVVVGWWRRHGEGLKGDPFVYLPISR